MREITNRLTKLLVEAVREMDRLRAEREALRETLTQIGIRCRAAVVMSIREPAAEFEDIAEEAERVLAQMDAGKPREPFGLIRPMDAAHCERCGARPKNPHGKPIEMEPAQQKPDWPSQLGTWA